MNNNWTHKISRLFERRALVLMYHRVADVPVDPWQMAVSKENFEEQLQVLQKKHQVISVKELIRQHQNGSLSPGSVCVTFDDGYADNYLTALPLLEKHQCPATFFIVTQYIGQKHSFWWDVLGDVLLNTVELPGTLSLPVLDDRWSFELNGEAVLTEGLKEKHRSWHWPDPPPTKRAKVYLDLYEHLKSFPREKQQIVLDEIRSWQGKGEPVARQEDHPVTAAQLMDLSMHPLLDIGLHTHSHLALGAQTVEVQQQEIENCRKYLKTSLQHYIPVLSYPHGHYNQDTLTLIKDQQLTAAFTTEGQAITKRTNPYRMGRFQVGNWDGELFEQQLSTWMGGRQ